MDVYIEYIFLDNLAINVFILYLTLYIHKKGINKIMLLASATVGAIFSMLYPFLGLYNYIVKILLGFIMCLMLTRYKSFSDYIYTLITFYLVSFMLAGAVVMLSSFKIVDLTKYNGELQLIPFCLFSSSLIILVLFKFCRKELYKRKRLQSLIYPIKVQAHNNEFIETFAFYDSGNQLYNPRNNKPIVIISQRLFDKLPKNNESFILVKTIAGYKNLITINITFRLYFNTKLNKIYKVQAGVSNDMNIDYDMILHTEMIGD